MITMHPNYLYATKLIKICQVVARIEEKPCENVIKCRFLGLQSCRLLVNASEDCSQLPEIIDADEMRMTAHFRLLMCPHERVWNVNGIAS